MLLQALFQMDFIYLISVPAEIQKVAVPISGNKSTMNNSAAYLVIKENDAIQKTFQIRFGYHYSAFQYHETKDLKRLEEFF